MTRATIKIIVPHFFPEVNALTNRLESFIPQLSHKCDIRVVFLLEPGEKFDISKTKEKFISKNIDFHPVTAHLYNKNNFLTRTIGETRNNYKLWRKAKVVVTDSLFVSIPQLMLLPVSGAFLIFDKTPRKILEIRDLTWEYLSFDSGLISAIIKKMFEKLAIFSIKKFDEVIVCTEAQAQFVREHTKCSVTVVRNGIAYEKFLQLSSLPIKKESKYITVSYFGTFGHAQNLLIFVKAAKHLVENKNIKFVLAGSGPDTERIKKYIAINKLSNIDVFDKMPWSELLLKYANTDILYAQLKPGSGFEKAEPSKLFEYFSTGKHILYGGTGLGDELANSFANVSVIYPDDELILAKCLVELSKIELEVCSEDQVRIEKYFVRENIFDRYIKNASFK